MSCGSPWDIAGCLVEVLGILQNVLWLTIQSGSLPQHNSVKERDVAPS